MVRVLAPGLVEPWPPLSLHVSRSSGRGDCLDLR